jgi:hypothetical protein
MAIPAQGCRFRWTYWPGSSVLRLREIQEFQVRPRFERFDSSGFSFTYQGGELILTGRSLFGLRQQNIGRWGTMKISVREGSSFRVLHEGYAQYVACDVRASTNEAVLFAFQFRLWGVFQTTGSLQSS